MVRTGEFLERMVVIQSGAVALEGLYHRGRRVPSVVLAAPHPRFGGSMDSPPVAELAWALTQAGYATLRFNYRAVGASQGAWEEGRHDVADLEAALGLLADTVGGGPLAVVGYSYGARVALDVARRRPLAALVLVSPAVTLLEHAAAVAALAAAGAPPTLVVTGAKDPLAPPAKMAEIFEPLGTVRQRVLPHADHAWMRDLPDLGREVAGFIHGRTGATETL